MSSLSSKTNSLLKFTIEFVLESHEDLQDEIKLLLNFWLKNSIEVQDALTKWGQNVSHGKFYAVSSLTNKESRIKYIRYKLFGVVDDVSKYQVGNPTYFSLP